MSQHLHLDPQALQHAIDYYTQVHDTLDDHYRKAVDTAQYLYGPAWGGPAAESHSTAFREWADNFRTAITAIEVMRDNLHNAHTNYTTTEGDNATAISNTHIATISNAHVTF